MRENVINGLNYRINNDENIDYECWVDLGCLTRKYGVGANMDNVVIDWSNSISKEIKFNYKKTKGVFKILKYNGRNLLLLYNSKEFSISTQNIKTARLGKIINDKFKYNNYKLNIGDIISDNNRNLIITDREYRIYTDRCGEKIKKWYKYKCIKCKWREGWISEYDVTRSIGCSCCKGLTVVEGINDIATTAPWMIKYFANPEDAKKYTYGSGKNIDVKCPDCGEVKSITLNNLYKNRSIGCNCGDGISYPEKFVYSMLKQLGDNFNTQTSKKDIKWCENYKYDFYIPSLNCIIETHGEQHYEETKRKGGRTLKQEQENDRLKRELALKNGIKYYIELDCRKSDLEWIKNSILNSELGELFDLSKVNWIKCEEFALKNIVREVCEYWNIHKKQNSKLRVSDLLKIFNIKHSAIRDYLKRGTALKWCFYDGEAEHLESNKANGYKNTKPIEVLKGNISYGVFESGKYIERNSEKLFGERLDFRNISAVALGKRKTHKGLTFKYIEENQNIAS